MKNLFSCNSFPSESINSVSGRSSGFASSYYLPLPRASPQWVARAQGSSASQKRGLQWIHTTFPFQSRRNQNSAGILILVVILIPKGIKITKGHHDTLFKISKINTKTIVRSCFLEVKRIVH
ncbi:MAG: hypothetical protein AMS17_14290 [Spirochaetes bacterium DG_61]|nr:MAG: hypothetical protein AMS17_14290 [Spirochaetes bacterium DG_61]